MIQKDLISKKPRYLKIKEVAKIFRVSHKTVYAWCDEGIISFIKVGGTVRVISSSVDKIEKECLST